MVDYYQVLGVKSTASVTEIKAAYKKLARRHHPDLNGGSAEAAQAFVQLSYARDLLIDPKRRAEYDAERNAQPGPGSYAPVLKPAGEDYLRRARSDARVRRNLACPSMAGAKGSCSHGRYMQKTRATPG